MFVPFLAFCVCILYFKCMMDVFGDWRRGIRHPKARHFRRCYLLVTPIAFFIIRMTMNKSIESSCVIAGACSVAAYLDLMLFAMWNSRPSKMDKAYAQYDMYRNEGRDPVIITDSVFGPVVEPDRPWNLHSSVIMTTTGGKLDPIYEITTRRKFDYARETFGSGPY